jgi:hypothetical protein
MVFQTTSKKGAPGYWLLPKESNKPLPLKLRRVGYLSGFSFDAQGQLYFGYLGDLWLGSVCSLSDDQESGYWVCGVRIAPLANLETNFSTPTNQGVQATAPSGGSVYLHLLRLGGSGWGQIASIAAPAIKFTDGEAQENGSYSLLCSSRSGKSVFYRATEPQANKAKIWLVNDGKTEEVVDEDLLGFGQ